MRTDTDTSRNRDAGAPEFCRDAVRTGETLRFPGPRPSYGQHTLRVRVTGGHGGQSGASSVSVDRAEVYVD